MCAWLDELQRGHHCSGDVLRVLDLARLASSWCHRLVFCDSAITRTFTKYVA
jgi:hypothetical protein